MYSFICVYTEHSQMCAPIHTQIQNNSHMHKIILQTCISKSEQTVTIYTYFQGQDYKSDDLHILVSRGCKYLKLIVKYFCSLRDCAQIA